MMLDQRVRLPCGAELPNRLAKAAMSEHLAEWDNTPGAPLANLYRHWSRGGTGLLITGNAMIDPASMESARNVVAEQGRALEGYAAWARAGTEAGNHLWMQLNHPGRQTPRNLNPEPVAPSAGVTVDLFRRLRAFGVPRALRPDEIEAIVERFADAAALAQQAGFTGVQVHGAHGYLVSQFLSPRTNLRDDAWGGPLERRARFLRAIVAAIRTRCGPAFPIGVKLNSADFQRGGFDESDSIRVLAMLAEDAVDLVEISGGNYEAQAMFRLADGMNDREAYFLDFAERARDAVPDLPLMVTGGFRTRRVMERAVASGAADVIGMARPLAADPALSAALLRGETEGSVHGPQSFGVRRLDAISEGGFCMLQFHRLARNRPTMPTAGAYRATLFNLGYMAADGVRLASARRRAGG